MCVFTKKCNYYLYQIQQVLGISGIATKTYAYHGSDTQMDMVIERADGIVNLCEMKYTGSAYNLTKSEADKIQNRIDQLVNLIRPKGINVVLITSKSAQHNDYYNQLINNNITINDLFVL